MKNKLFRLLALTVAAIMLFSLAACSGSTDETTTAAETEALTEVVSEQESASQDSSAQTEAAVSEPLSPEAAVSEPLSTEAAGETTTAAKKELPKTTEEILALYNASSAALVKNKVAFSKTRETKEGTYDAGIALRTFKGLVYQFMGIGSDNIYTKDVAKNDDSYEKYAKASTLGIGDIKSATVKESGTNYIVTINIKDGSSSVTEGGSIKINAPLDKSGISAGKDDKDYYDHKTAQNVYDAIDDVASGATIVEKYSNAVLVATIDSATGNIIGITVTFDIEYSLDHVMGSSGNATGTSTVIFKNFKW